jgi:hypothetical protein
MASVFEIGDTANCVCATAGFDPAVVLWTARLSSDRQLLVKIKRLPLYFTLHQELVNF